MEETEAQLLFKDNGFFCVFFSDCRRDRKQLTRSLWKRNLLSFCRSSTRKKWQEAQRKRVIYMACLLFLRAWYFAQVPRGDDKMFALTLPHKKVCRLWLGQWVGMCGLRVHQMVSPDLSFILLLGWLNRLAENYENSWPGEFFDLSSLARQQSRGFLPRKSQGKGDGNSET